jgi:ABC-2 type transport system ATP-binding protein
MIQCRSLTMKYGDFTAVDQLDLEVAKGEICALLGPNGAGKSTTLKMLSGLAVPTSGSVTVAGAMPSDVKQRIGVLPENLGLFDDLTVGEHLALSADLYGLSAATSRERIDQLLRVLSLEHGRDTLASRCSHGMRKKTSFAMALLHNPEVLFLDEPFEAIDPVSARLMFEVLQEAAARGTTVFLTSHILAMVEALAGRFVLIRSGRLVLNATRAELPGPLAELYFKLVESPVTEKLEWLGSGRS